MAIIQKSYRGPDAWTGAANILSSFVKNKEDAYQRQRQEEADARAAAYHAQRMRNLGLDITEKERVAGNILSDEELAAQMGIAFAPSSVPTTPSNFGQYPGEGGREPATVTTGFAPTEDARNLARVKMGRGMTPDAALVIQRMQNYAHSLEQRKEQALAAGDLRAAKDEDLKLKKVNYTIALQKEKAGAREETWRDRSTVQRDIQQPDAMGLPPHGYPTTTLTGADAFDSREEYDKHLQYGLGQGYITSSDVAGLADVTSGKTFWERMTADSGLTSAKLRSTLADEMKKIASNITDYSDDRGDVLDSVEQSQIIENLFKAATELGEKYPDRSVYDIYLSLKSHPRNYVDFTDVSGWDDAAPMKLQQIKDAYDALISGETNQGPGVGVATADGTAGTALVRITNDEEWDRLDIGTEYIGPDGVKRIKE